MSLLNFLFKDRAVRRAEKVEAETILGEETILGAAEPEEVAAVETSVVEEDTQQISVHSSLTDASGMPDLDEIRAMLSKIAEIISDDETEEQAEDEHANLSTIDMSLSQINELKSGLFKVGHPSPEEASRTVGVRIPDLYEQLKTGKVLTSLARLLTEVPAEILSNPADGLSKDDVSIPLSVAVTSVRPDELMRRTTSSERDVGLKDMPNLFSVGPDGAATLNSQAKMEASAAAAAARVTPVEPAKPVEPVPSMLESALVPPPMAETTLKAPRSAEKKTDDDIFARDPQAAPEPTPAPAEPAAPAAPKVAGGFSFEYNENATPFRRIDQGGESAAEPAASEPTVEEPAQPEMAESAAPVVEDVEPAPVAEELIDAPFANQAVASNIHNHETIAFPPPTNPGVVLVEGVDLNQASAAELAERIDGVGQRLAENIVRYREQNGGFGSPEGLVEVPGIGPTTYERITGLSWGEAHDELQRELEFILGDTEPGYPDFRAVADRFCQGQSFNGCVIVHTDGHVLASSWLDQQSEILGAIAPQIFKKVSPYAEQLMSGEVNPISLVFGQEVITMVQSGEILIAVVHQLDQLDKSQMRLVQLAIAELDLRMDRVGA